MKNNTTHLKSSLGRNYYCTLETSEIKYGYLVIGGTLRAEYIKMIKCYYEKK